jgi:hypothetical protein
MEAASTQYTDVKGTSAADWHEHTQFINLAKAAGVNTDRYFPVGVTLSGVELEITKIYAVDTTKAGGRDFESIRTYLRANPGDVEEFECSIEGIGRFMKRLEVQLGHRDLFELI